MTVVDFRPKRDEAHVPTPTSSKIEMVLQDTWSHARLAIVRGSYGVGKTYTFQSFAAGNEGGVILVTLDPTAGSRTGGIARLCRQLEAGVRLDDERLYLATVGQTNIFRAVQSARDILRQLGDEFAKPLVIVDEAQYARPDLLDILRAFWDERLCGLCLGGNHQLFNPRSGRMQMANFGAVLSRAHHVLEIAAPTAGDIAAVCDAHRITGPDSRALLADCAAAGGLHEVFNVLAKARALAGAPIVGLKHLRAAAQTTGMAGAAWTRRRR